MNSVIISVFNFYSGSDPVCRENLRNYTWMLQIAWKIIC